MSSINRRSFLNKAGIGALTLGSLAKSQHAKDAASPDRVRRESPESVSITRYAVERCATEWAYASGRAYSDPFNDVELDVVFRDPLGQEQRVPAFWAGEQIWRVRYAPPAPGRYTYRTVSSDRTNPDLHGQHGVLEVSAYRGSNPLISHGRVRVTSDHFHFEHEDGTPFFWLGDTWWMGLCQRLNWPDDFRTLAADRVQKGFTVIQIIAGLYPDMPPFDPRGANEAGYPWQENYARINPHYFDMADLRIQYLVDHGLLPCIVGCWGYFLPFMGLSKIKQHWRNLIARWGAFPVIWCLAGEGTMPYYLSKNKAEDAAVQKHGWTDVAEYVRGIDPYHRLVTIHPSRSARDTVEDPAVLDFDMLQTGHNDRPGRRGLLRRGSGRQSRGSGAIHVLGLHAEWCGGSHLRSGRDLAGQHQRASLRALSAWWYVGRTALGQGLSTSRLAAGGARQGTADALSLVAFRAPPGMGGAALEQRKLHVTLRGRHSRRVTCCVHSSDL
ncbi:MAG: hypothetical protein DMG23_02105 [Acidobacteria bacterium]|nr:MAG: hypothetical protein DMG23_02105 [Acidobacteriota bacterium]